MKNFFRLNLLNIDAVDCSLDLKFKNLLLSFLLGFGLIFTSVAVIILPLDFIVTKIFCFESIRDLIHQKQNLYSTYPLYIVILVGPFFEEILFRLGLRFNRVNISIFLGVFVYVILGGKITTFRIDNHSYLYFALIGLIIFVVSWFYFPLKIIEFLENKKQWLIPISILLFGLMHILNIKTIYWQLILLYPFYVLPQIIMGYFITNLRLKYGFFWGLSLHVLINAFAFLLK